MQRIVKLAFVFVFMSLLVHANCRVPSYPTRETINAAIKSNAPDTTIARLYSQYQYSISISDPAEAISALKEAAKYSLKANHAKGVAEAYARIGQIYQQLNLNNLALEYLQKAYGISAKNYDEGSMAYLLSDIANVYFSLKLIDIAEPYYRRGLTMMQRNHNDAGSAVMLNNIALCKMNQNKPDSALVYFQKALKLRENIHDEFLVCHSLNYIGLIYKQKGDLEQAEAYFQQVIQKLSLPENLFEPSVQLRSSVENSLWQIYHERGNEVEARKWLNKSMESSKSISDGYTLCDQYLYRSGIALNDGRISEALDDALKAYQIGKEHGFTNHLKNSCYQLVDIYTTKKDFANSSRYFKEYSAYCDTLINMQTAESLTRLHSIIQSNIQDIEIQNQRTKQTQMIRFLLLCLILLFIVVMFLIYTEFTKRQSNLRLKQLADASHELIVIHDMGTIIETNQRVYEIMGYTREETIGNSLSIFICPEDLPLVQSKMATKDLQSYEVRLIKKDGSIIFVEIMSRPYIYAGKALRVAAIRDISENKKFIESLINTSSELRKLNSTKDRLFSIIAHDLKNPFNAIIGFTELMKKSIKDFTSEELHDMISMIHESSSTAYSLLENLLDWARLQTGSLPFSPKPQDLQVAVNNVISIQIAAITAKKLSINNNITEQTTVVADSKMLNTILLNLISNAVKFTRQGGKITITAHSTKTYCIVEVNDTGIGLTSKQMNSLFNIDKIESRAGTNNEPGTGLGLILCKDLMELHRGSIGVVSTVGKGTTITLSFPNK